MRDIKRIPEDLRTCFFNVPLVTEAADAIEELLGEVERAENRHVVESEMIDEMYAENERLKNKVPTWISAEERLPESDDWVIVAILDERGDTPYQYTDFGWYLDAARCWIINAEQRRDVTHWMPLSEPPKEVE